MTAVRIENVTGASVTNVSSHSSTNGIVIVDSTVVTIRNAYIDDSSGAGILLDGVTGSDIQAVVNRAGQHGIHLVDSDRNRITGIVKNASENTNNTYDGVHAETSDENRIAVTVVDDTEGNQMRYGVNIASGTTNIEASMLKGTGATAPYNDSGTDTRTTQDHIVT